MRLDEQGQPVLSAALGYVQVVPLLENRKTFTYTVTTGKGGKKLTNKLFTIKNLEKRQPCSFYDVS